MANKIIGFNKEWQKFLMKTALKANIVLNEKQAINFADYAKELTRWNKKMNLTAITSPEDIAIKHIIDSLTILRLCPHNISLLDIGSGAGFPGIPIKIVRNDIKVSLIESSGKKTSFLRNIIIMIRLEGIKAFDIRAEAAKNMPDFSYNFDAVVCKGFASFVNFLKIARYFLKKQGIIIAFKGKNFKEELKEAIPLYPNFNFNAYEYKLPVLNHKRAVIIAVKKGASML
ncbi:MAG: 16S rRNA (guanine(527)-N(7))-methyltransferase RsmG [Deltaproteobacteria bacterium]|nr:16S rRNA (guanine(527)-N(7))-methyltransferase RsmG [Deltaproteobacteria bacterium]